MHTANGTLRISPAQLDMSVVVGPAWVMLSEHRKDFIFDSRFMSPASDSVPASILYILIEGSFRWLGGPTFDGPCAFIASASYFDGENGKRELAYRSRGSNFRAVELRVGCDAFGTCGSHGPERVLLSEAAMQAARDVQESEGDAERKSHALALLAHLQEEQILQRGFTSRSVVEEAVDGALWAALVPMLRHISLNSSSAEIASLWGTTSRGLHAALCRVVPKVHLGFTNWRAFARRYRLKLAVLFLSRPDVLLQDIAKAIGYASAEAMAHAFQDEGLRAPRDIRDAILAYRD